MSIDADQKWTTHFSGLIGSLNKRTLHVPSYPLQLEPNNPNKVEMQRSIRPTSVKQWKDNAKLKCAQESFTIDAGRLWNQAPQDIKVAETLRIAKTSIKKWCSQMTI